MSVGIKIFVINLDSDVKRMQNLDTSLRAQNIEYTRVSAVDGRKMPRDELANHFLNSYQMRLGSEIGASQAGCFLSHSKVWNLIANGEDDYGLVLEDDIHLSSDFEQFINSAEWLPEAFDIVRLEVPTNRLWLSKTDTLDFNQRKISAVKSTSWCAGAYLLSRDCAKRLVSLNLNKFISSDALLFCFEQSVIARELSIYQVTPALAIQDKYLSTSQVGYTSNIENFSLLTKLKWKVLNNINAFSITNQIKKALRGYQRVTYK